MATYIGFNTTLSNSISVTGFRYVVNPSQRISYPLVLLQDKPYSIGGTNYIVYMIGNGENYNLTTSWFVHLHNDPSITSTSDLPLDSQVIYATYSTVTFSPGRYPSGTLYRFSTSIKTLNKLNTWIAGKNPGEVAGAGTKYAYYNKQTSTVSSGKCTDYGFCPTSSSDGVSIVELYHSTNGVANATGFYTSIIDRSAAQSTWPTGTHKKWIYDYVNESDTSSNNLTRINGTGRKVFAIHNTTGGDCNLAIAYGGSTSAALSDTNYTIGAFGYTKVAYNTWAYHITEGKHYYSITVNKNNQFIETTLQLEANKAYTIKMHTYSEASRDGIIISTEPVSKTTLLSSAGMARCSGVNIKTKYNIESSSSDRTLYIYFKTDIDNLYGPGGTYFDSVGHGDSTTTYGHSTGDIEISSYVYTITFNKNGGTGGTTSTTVIPGKSLDLSTITKPTRDGWDFYKWAIDVNSFKFVSSPYKPTGNVTLYAVWDNFPKFTELSNKSVYCTDDCIAASSTQGSKSIKLFSGAGMTCSAGTVTYAADKSRVYPKGSPTSPISGATIQPVGTDNNVTVPEGTPAGDYIAAIAVYTSLSPKIPGSYFGPHSAQPAVYNIPFTIKATTLTYGPVELIQHTPDDIIEGNITQQKNFPAGRFTISTSTIGDYFTVYGVFRQVVTCNNGRVREGNVTVNGWVPTPGFKDIVVSSLGTTISDAYTYTFASSNGNALVFNAAGEGNKLFQRFVLSGVREANALTGISLSLGSSSINYNSTTTATVTATYTSGSSKDVTDSLSTNPSATSNYINSRDTSIVTIS